MARPVAAAVRCPLRCALFMFMVMVVSPSILGALAELAGNASEGGASAASAGDALEALEDSFGGDSQSLLMWALEASDPDKLRELAEESAQADSENANRRAAEVRAFAKALHHQRRTETDVLKDAVAVLRNASAPADALVLAMEEIADLVRSFDHASDFVDSIEGVPDLVRMVHHGAESVSSAAVAAVAAGSGNHGDFVKAVLAHEEAFATTLLALIEAPPSSRQRRATIALGHLVRTPGAPVPDIPRVAGALQTIAERATDDPRLAAAALTVYVDVLKLPGGSATADSSWADALDAAIAAGLATSNADLVEKALATTAAATTTTTATAAPSWAALADRLARRESQTAIHAMDDERGTLASLTQAIARATTRGDEL